MLDGRVLGASQVEYKPFEKPPLKRGRCGTLSGMLERCYDRSERDLAELRMARERVYRETLQREALERRVEILEEENRNLRMRTR